MRTRTVWWVLLALFLSNAVVMGEDSSEDVWVEVNQKEQFNLAEISTTTRWLDSIKDGLKSKLEEKKKAITGKAKSKLSGKAPAKSSSSHIPAPASQTRFHPQVWC